MNIAEYLRFRREQLKIPRRQIAQRLCISPQALRDIENGSTRLSLENFLIICDALGISPMQLIKKTDEHYILLTDKDLTAIDRSIEILQKIRTQADNDGSASYEKITIGDGNTIENSFNKK